MGTDPYRFNGVTIVWLPGLTVRRHGSNPAQDVDIVDPAASWCDQFQLLHQRLRKGQCLAQGLAVAGWSWWHQATRHSSRASLQQQFGEKWRVSIGSIGFVENTSRKCRSPRGVTWFPSKPCSTSFEYLELFWIVSYDFNHGLLNLGMALGNLSCDEVEAAWWHGSPCGHCWVVEPTQRVCNLLVVSTSTFHASFWGRFRLKIAYP